jgi:serine/threonine protein kinase
VRPTPKTYKPDLNGDIQANILVDSDGRAYLADFGCSLLVKSGTAVVPEYHRFSGSPRYTAPEKMTEREYPLGVASDVWSLACTIYEVANLVFGFL